MSSGGATQAHRAFVAYDATKGGIEAMTHVDARPRPLWRSYQRDRPMRQRMGVPADLTGAAVFLTSDDSLYVTDQRTVVDGSMLAQQRSATVDIMLPSDFPKVWAREQV